MTSPGCKGCQGPNGAAGCPVHGGSGNDIICGSCGYRGPQAGHGPCTSDPVKVIARLRERVEKLEGRMDRIEGVVHVSAPAAETPKPAPPVEDGEFAALVADLVGAWRRSKAVNEEYERHRNDFHFDGKVLERKAEAGKAIAELLDRLDVHCAR